jgi:mannose-6-phosphate isomerase-like protein (cupin superfamily)
MAYALHAHSPRFFTTPRRPIPTPEHFYLIEKGTGDVKHDTGSSVGPGMVLIPAGEWHQLIASESGFDYIEFRRC